MNSTIECYNDGARQDSVNCSRIESTGESRKLQDNFINLTDCTSTRSSLLVNEVVAVRANREVATAEVSDVATRIGTVHKELSERRFRKLEDLLDKIVQTSNCHCDELKTVMRSFEKFQSALIPCLFREQYLLLPTIVQKLTAERAGIVYPESYDGEIEDMIRTAGADHNQLQFLAQQLVKDIRVLTEKGHCPSVIRSFGVLFDEFSEVLRSQFNLEDAVLLPHCLTIRTESI